MDVKQISGDVGQVEGDLMTVHQLASFAGVGYCTVYKWIAELDYKPDSHRSNAGARDTPLYNHHVFLRRVKKHDGKEYVDQTPVDRALSDAGTQEERNAVIEAVTKAKIDQGDVETAALISFLDVELNNAHAMLSLQAPETDTDALTIGELAESFDLKVRAMRDLIKETGIEPVGTCKMVSGQIAKTYSRERCAFQIAHLHDFRAVSSLQTDEYKALVTRGLLTEGCTTVEAGEDVTSAREQVDAAMTEEQGIEEIRKERMSPDAPPMLGRVIGTPKQEYKKRVAEANKPRVMKPVNIAAMVASGYFD